MNRNHPYRARRNLLFDQRWLDVEGRQIDVDEARHGAAIDDCVRRGDPGERRNDDFIALADVQRSVREMQRRSSGGACYCVRRADERGETSLEIGNERPLYDPSALERLCCGFDLLLPEERLGNRNGRRHRREYTGGCTALRSA